MNRIFDEFHQLQDAYTGNFDGFGLGLNIVKKYLELMGGDIRVESAPGVGSTFTFILPYAVDFESARESACAEPHLLGFQYAASFTLQQ